MNQTIWTKKFQFAISPDSFSYHSCKFSWMLQELNYHTWVILYSRNWLIRWVSQWLFLFCSITSRWNDSKVFLPDVTTGQRNNQSYVLDKWSSEGGSSNKRTELLRKTGLSQFCFEIFRLETWHLSLSFTRTLWSKKHMTLEVHYLSCTRSLFYIENDVIKSILHKNFG